MDIQTLERVQQRAIRVLGLQSPIYEGKLKELGLLSLEDRRSHFDLVQTFKKLEVLMICAVKYGLTK